MARIRLTWVEKSYYEGFIEAKDADDAKARFNEKPDDEVEMLECVLDNDSITAEEAQ